MTVSTGPVEGAARRRTFHTLDALRGVAAAIVLTRHAPSFFGQAMFHGSSLGVDLFFIMSGFVIAHAYERRLHDGMSTWQFLKIRLIRLYPLYILGTLIGIAVAAGTMLTGVKSSATGFEWDWPTWTTATVTSLFLLPTPPIPGSHGSLYPLNAVAWSLAFELLSNVIYAATIRFWTNRNILVLMTVSALGLIVTGYHFQTLDLGWNWENLIGGFARIGYSFPCGLLLYRLFTQRRSRTGLVCFAPLVVAVVLFTIRVPDAYRVPTDLLIILFAFPGLVHFAASVEPPPSLVRSFAFLGVVSYAVYALHRPVLSVVNGAAQVAKIDLAAFAPWSGIPFLALFLFACWLVDEFYDQPVRRYCSRRLVSAKQPPIPEASASR